jgi:release factor glutamine methyltransferase
MTGRGLYKRLVFPWLAPLTRWYLRKPRAFTREGLGITVLPGVFHPGFFLSTGVLLQYLKTLELRAKSVLELGAGAGMLAVFAARQGARVVASDISATAVDNVTLNARKNGVVVEALQSDLFSTIPPQQFGLVLINPPYYPRNPESEAGHAWYCGTGHEYFQRLFSQLSQLAYYPNEVVMVLSEDCRLHTIQSLAEGAGLEMMRFHAVRKRFEWHYLYRIRRNPKPA